MVIKIRQIRMINHKKTKVELDQRLAVARELPKRKRMLKKLRIRKISRKKKLRKKCLDPKILRMIRNLLRTNQKPSQNQMPNQNQMQRLNLMPSQLRKEMVVSRVPLLIRSKKIWREMREEWIKSIRTVWVTQPLE